MAAPGIAVQFFDGLYAVGAKGVQVNIPDQGQQIGVFVAQDGFVPVLEYMTGALVPAVEIL